MGAYFDTLDQAEKHIDDKNTLGRGKIEWQIIDCTIGFLVVSVAEAKRCFPHLFKTTSNT